jgi:hypothetical protein
MLRLLCIVLVLSNALSSAETYPVTGVPTAASLGLTVKGFPVVMSLAHLVPATGMEAACQAKLASLTEGKRVELLYMPDFGADERGNARVQVVVDKTNVNEALVAAGLASYQPVKPDSSFEGGIKRAQDKAQRAKVGQWAAAPVAAAAKPAPVPVKAPAKTAAIKPGPYVAELDNDYYYKAGAPEVARVDPQRLISYASPAAAEKAGKRVRSATAPLKAPAGGGTEADGDAIFAQGKAIYAEAIAAGNTTARDDLYEKAYVYLTQGMNIYAALAEKRQDDEALGEKLRECMQLRYGSVKQRRFAH